MDNMIALSRVDVSAATPPAGLSMPRVMPASETETGRGCCMDSLAMAYVPMQQWQNLYEPDVAFARATLFAELDKPFIGEEVRFK